MEIQSRPELAFDEQQHLYTLGGLVLPSVTPVSYTHLRAHET